MGLHQRQLFPHKTSSYETLERAKVVHSLYVRDKSLCITRGSVSWLPNPHCNIIPQLSAAVKCQAPYSNILQLAMIQEEIYRLMHSVSSRTRRPNKSQTAKVLRSIEHHLDQYARTYSIFGGEIFPFDSRRAILTLEFLSTRIFALEHGSEQRHVEQVHSDARASCILLLITHGVQDSQIIDTFKDLTHQKLLILIKMSPLAWQAQSLSPVYSMPSRCPHPL
jgi:hypothetical protein